MNALDDVRSVVSAGVDAVITDDVAVALGSRLGRLRWRSGLVRGLRSQEQSGS